MPRIYRKRNNKSIFWKNVLIFFACILVICIVLYIISRLLCKDCNHNKNKQISSEYAIDLCKLYNLFIRDPTTITDTYTDSSKDKYTYYNWGWIKTSPPLIINDQYVLEQFGELYWLGELKPSQPCGKGCVNWDKTYDNCTNTLYSTTYKDKPVEMLTNVFNKTKTSNSKICSDPKNPVTTGQHYVYDSPLPLSSDLFKNSNHLIPTFSIEGLSNGNDLSKGCIASKHYGATLPSQQCKGAGTGPIQCNKVCGTFDGFSTWTLEKFYEYLKKVKEKTGHNEVCIYESQFIPKSWLDSSTLSSIDSDLKIYLWHEGIDYKYWPDNNPNPPPSFYETLDENNKKDNFEAYCNDIINFVKKINAKVCYFLIGDPSISDYKYCIPQNGDKQSYLTKYFLNKLPNYCDAGVIGAINPKYAWHWKDTSKFKNYSDNNTTGDGITRPMDNLRQCFELVKQLNEEVNAGKKIKHMSHDGEGLGDYANK